MPRTYTRTCNCLRCPKCRDREQSRTRIRMKRAGTWNPWIPAQPVIDHIQTLRDHGLSYRQIGKLTDTPRQTIEHIHRYGRAKVDRDIATRILNTKPRPSSSIPSDHLSSPVGARRRIQALMALGYTQTEIARRVGSSSEHISVISRGVTGSIHNDLNDRISKVYDELWTRPGPSKRGRDRARRQGYISPLGWDDDTIDDPTAEPAIKRPAAVWGITDTTRRKLPDWHVLAAEVNERSATQVAARYGVDHKTINKALTRAGYVNIAPLGAPGRYVPAEDVA